MVLIDCTGLDITNNTTHTIVGKLKHGDFDSVCCIGSVTKKAGSINKTFVGMEISISPSITIFEDKFGNINFNASDVIRAGIIAVSDSVKKNNAPDLVPSGKYPNEGENIPLNVWWNNLKRI